MKHHPTNEAIVKSISDAVSVVVANLDSTTSSSSQQMDCVDDRVVDTSVQGEQRTCSVCSECGVSKCSTCDITLCVVHRKKHKSTRVTSLHDIVDFTNNDAPSTKLVKPDKSKQLLCLDGIENAPKRLIRKVFSLQFDMKSAEETAKQLFDDYQLKRLHQITVLQQLKKEDKNLMQGEVGKKKRKACSQSISSAMEMESPTKKVQASSFVSGISSEQRYLQLVENGTKLTINDVDWIPYNILRKECSKNNLGGIGSAETLRTRLRMHISTTVHTDHPELDVIQSVESALIRMEAKKNADETDRILNERLAQLDEIDRREIEQYSPVYPSHSSDFVDIEN